MEKIESFYKRTELKRLVVTCPYEHLEELVTENGSI